MKDKKARKKLDQEINRCIEKMSKMDAGSDEYKAMMECTLELGRLKRDIRLLNMSGDAVINAMSHIMGLALVGVIDQTHPTVGRAWNMASKTKN